MLLIDSGLAGLCGRGTTRAEDAPGTPAQSHISPSIIVCEDNQLLELSTLGVVHFRCCQLTILSTFGRLESSSEMLQVLRKIKSIPDEEVGP